MRCKAASLRHRINLHLGFTVPFVPFSDTQQSGGLLQRIHVIQPAHECSSVTARLSCC
jgi:hypothetical protein